MLCNFLSEKGLNVCDCKLLTTFDGARTLSYRLTINPCDFEKAKDPSIWPYRVGLRLFKHFNRNIKNSTRKDDFNQLPKKFGSDKRVRFVDNVSFNLGNYQSLV